MTLNSAHQGQIFFHHYVFHPSWERAVTLIVHRMAANLTRISAINHTHPTGVSKAFETKNTFELIAFCAQLEVNCLDPRCTLIRLDIILFC